MTTTILKDTVKKRSSKPTLPTTARGRALHTVDWYLNGKPVLSHYDNPRLSLTTGEPCF